MLVIHPGKCINCGVCEPECPVHAIIPDSAPDAEKWLSINTKYAEKWPNIRLTSLPPRDADDFAEQADKFSRYFDPNPGTGNG